jgi:hypothetical protein
LRPQVPTLQSVGADGSTRVIGPFYRPFDAKRCKACRYAADLWAPIRAPWAPIRAPFDVADSASAVQRHGAELVTLQS